MKCETWKARWASTPIPAEFVDMFAAGIVDPTKVTRSALQNASSIAALMLTTEAMITNIKDDEKENAARVEGSVR